MKENKSIVYIIQHTNLPNMFLILLGLILFFVAKTIANPNTQFFRYQRIGMFAGVAMMILGVMSKIFVVIDPGTVGVQTLFGSVQGNVLESGLRIVNPLMDITEYNVRTQNYTMSAVNNEGTQSGDDAIRVLTSDGLEVVIDLSVLYRVNPVEAPKILSTIGRDYEGVIIRPLARTRIRDNAVYYEAIALISSKRDEFQTRIFQTIEKDFRDRGLVLEQILIRNIALPESVKTTIEGKISAEQEAQKMQFVLQKEKQEAERKRVEAQGIADYQRIISTGLGDKQLQYEQIKAMKELAASPNAKIVIMNGKSAPILLNQ
jgi:regulator of protease activity HflC (stomatin/prohibitin superfamily)